MLQRHAPMLKSFSALGLDRATTDITLMGTILRIVITIGQTMATTIDLTIGTAATVTTVITIIATIGTNLTE